MYLADATKTNKEKNNKHNNHYKTKRYAGNRLYKLLTGS